MSLRRFGWPALLALGCLAFSAHYSRLAPCGAWGNSIFGEEAWGEADPGGFYFAAAHELAFRESPLFVGHPGATLLPLLWSAQAGLHAAWGGQVPFTRFTAQHLPEVFLASKLLMTLLHLLSFAALHALARALLRDRAAAALATLGYATCLPVLYYLSRISVEPLQIACFAAAFVAGFRYEDRAREGRRAPALLFAALSAALAVSCAMSKLAFGAPLPLLLALQIALGPWRSEPGGSIAPRLRGQALAAFGVAGGVSLLLYSQIIDWSLFASAWRAIARRPVSDGWQLQDFAPGLGASHIYLASELGFLLVSAAGLALFLRERPQERRRALLLAAYGLYGLLFFGYRVALEGGFLPFHYAFLLQAVAAVFFGHASLRAWRRLRGERGGGPAAVVAAAVWLALLHGVGLAGVVDSRRHDALEFEQRAALFPLVAQLAPGEQLGVVHRRWRRQTLERRLVRVHGFFPLFWDTREPRLMTEFQSFFSVVRPGRVRDAGTFVPILDAKVVRLEPQPAPAGELGGGPRLD